MAENRVRIVIEVDGRDAQAVIDGVGRRFRDMGGDAKEASAATKGMASSMNTLTTAAKLAASAFAAYKIADYVRESAVLAARYETMGVTMETLGRNAGYSAQQVNYVASALQKTGISMLESREQTARLIQANIDLAQATDLARLAQDTAVVAGLNSSETFSRLIYGIQTGQVEILRNIGLNVDFEASYKSLAKELKKTTQQLSEHEKMQARVNVVMSKAGDVAGAYESAMMTAGKALTSLPRYFEDFQVKFGQAFGPATKILVDAMGDSMKRMQEIIARPEIQAALQNIANLLAEAIAKGMTGISDWLAAHGSELPTMASSAATGFADLAGNIASSVTELSRFVTEMEKIPKPILYAVAGGLAGGALTRNLQGVVAGLATGAIYGAWEVNNKAMQAGQDQAAGYSYRAPVNRSVVGWNMTGWTTPPDLTPAIKPSITEPGDALTNGAQKYAEQANAFLNNITAGIEQLQDALTGGSEKQTLRIDRWFEQQFDTIRRSVAGAKGDVSAYEEAWVALEQAWPGLKILAVTKDTTEALQQQAGILRDIADATGDPSFSYQAGISEAEAWYERNKQLINQNVEDETLRATLLEGLERGVQVKRLEAQRDAYAEMGDASSAYWEAEKALLEQRLEMVKSTTDDEVAHKIYAAKEIDDFNRRRLEAIRDNPTSLGEAMSAAFALESGSYKTAFGRAQDDWRDTTQRMLRLTDDLSSGIAQGFGDAARQGVNHLVDMLGPMGSVFSRILDMVISLLEDIAAEYLRRGIMSLFFDDAQSLAQRLGGISPGGVAGGGSGGGIASTATGVVGDLLTGGISTMFQGGVSTVTSGVTSGAFGLGSSLLEGMMGAGVAGVPWAGAGAGVAGAAAGAGMGSLVMPIVGTLIGAGLGLLGSLFGGEEEKEEPPQEAWSGRSVMYSGGTMGGFGYTQMSDGSYKLSALDPMELEAERQQFQETVKDINAAAKTLEIDFDRNWDRDFSFFFPPVAEELAGLVERAMYSSAAATVLGELAPAAQLFSEGLEGLHDTLIRLGEAFGAVAGQVEPLGVDFARMGGVTDATLLALASLATGYNAGAAILRQAQEDQADSTEDLTDRFLAAGAAGAEVVRYFQQHRQQLQNLALASYSEQLVDIVGGQDNFDQVISTFAERAYEDRDRTEASINYYSSEFASKLGDATQYFPNFDVSTVLDNPGAFWAAYRAAMEQPMPPSAFEWWADMSGIVSNLQDFQDALADIELGERAWDQNLLARRQIADGQESAAELTQRAVQMEQELADARKNGATFTQQAALAETQAYELERERDRLLGVDDEADSLGEYVDDLKEAVAYQVSAVQSLAASALAASSAFDAARKALRDTVDDMLGLDADPAVTAARAAKEFSDLYQRTMRGDTEAAGQLAAAAEKLWESGRTVYDYDSLRASIVGRLTRAARYTELQDTYQGYAGGMATAQSGLLDYIYDAVSSDTPDAVFMADANSMAARMQAFVDASTLAAEGRMSAADVAALARETTASMMGTAGLADLLSGTLDVGSLTSDQAKLVLSAYNALQVLGEATDQQYQASAVTLRALDALASETLAQDEWTRVITAIEDGQEEYVDWLERNIAERRAEADRLYALQAQQLAAQESMSEYFEGISGYLLRQTNIETLTDTIADLQSQAGSYQQMAVMAMMAGVPMAAMMQMQQVSAINSQIAALQQELAYWIAYQPSLPQLAEGGIATRRTVAEIAEGRQSEAVVPLDQFWRALERVVAVLERTREEMTALTKEVVGNTAVQATEMRAARLAARSEVPA